MTLIDLITPAQDAIFLTLTSTIAPAEALVLQHVPQDTVPVPALVIVGEIEFEDIGGKGEQAERLTCEIHIIYRGEDRRVLIGLVNTVRGALLSQPIDELVEGVSLTVIAVDGVVSNAADDGLTYAAILTTIIDAEPA